MCHVHVPSTTELVTPNSSSGLREVWDGADQLPGGHGERRAPSVGVEEHLLGNYRFAVVGILREQFSTP